MFQLIRVIEAPLIITLLNELYDAIAKATDPDRKKYPLLYRPPFGAPAGDIRSSTYSLTGHMVSDMLEVCAIIKTSDSSSWEQWANYPVSYKPIESTLLAAMRRDIVAALKRHVLPDKNTRANYRLLKGGERTDDHSLTAICKELERFSHAIETRRPWKIEVGYQDHSDYPLVVFHWKENTGGKHGMNMSVSRSLTYTIEERARA